MHRVALLIGGNQGDRHALIDQATEQIRQRVGSVVALSRVYETEPWGEFADSETPSVPSLQGGVPEGRGGGKVPNFLNRALLVETTLSPREVLRTALEIEQELGRQRPASPNGANGERIYHSRPMDIDLIFYDDVVMDTAELTLPHPRMHLRRFVLAPLAEILPEYRHPLLHKTVRELLEECPVTPSGFGGDVCGCGCGAGVITHANM